MSKTILFFGNERLATGVGSKTPIFKGLIAAGYDIKALIVSQRSEKDKDQPEIIKVAQANNIPIKAYNNLKASAAEIAALEVDCAVLAAYGKIVPQEILDLFKIGIINIHPSLLPLHRGPTPIESCILKGETKTGVTIMKLAADMDSGPTYKQQAINLDGNETKQHLADKLNELGAKMLLESLDDIMTGSLKPSSQPNDGATYDSLITKADGIAKWDDTWQVIERKLRAYANWPKFRARLGSIDVVIDEAHYEPGDGDTGKITVINNQPAIYCADGMVVIDKLIPAGRKPMSGKDFVLGYGRQIV